MNAETFARLIDGARRSGAGWVGHCPAHDDERASFTFGDGDRRLVVTCHAGCSLEAIAKARGLRVSDFFNDNGTNARSDSRVVAEYEYRDERGELLYVVERREPKTFRQRRPDGSGAWIWNLGHVRRVLYRLPELIVAMKALPPGQRVVYIVEGEKDADRLSVLGLPATTNAGGANKWWEEYTRQLRAAGVERVVILPDHDDAGERHAAMVARSCLAAGIATKVVRLPGLPAKGDVSDWLDAGHTCEELAEVVNTAPTLDAATLEGTAIEPGARMHASSLFVFQPVGDLLKRSFVPPEWLVRDLLPLEGISVLVGRPKTGKTVMSRNLAAAVAQGTPFLGRAAVQGVVLYASLEDSARAVADHFRRLGVSETASLYIHCRQAPLDAVAALRTEAETRRPRLIVVDTLFRLARVRDEKAYAEVLAALDGLLAIAREFRCHVLLVHHAPKGSDSRDAIDAPLGSTSIAGTADVIMHLKRNGERRSLTAVYRDGAGEDLPETLVTLDKDTGVVTLGHTRQEADDLKVAQAIVEYLEGQTEPVDEPTLHDNVDGRRGTKVRAIRRLVEEKHVTRTGAGKKGDPYHYAVSGSLVPDVDREPESQNPPIVVSAHGGGEDSGSGLGAPLDCTEPASAGVLEL